MTNSLNKFASDHNISLRLTSQSERADGSNGDWPDNARHWHFELRTLTTDHVVSGDYTQGSAHTERPTVADILEGLALDANCVDQCVDVLEFAQEFGYDLGEPGAVDRCRLVYKACQDMHASLTTFLGPMGLEALYLASNEDPM
jgi:hypothetical protein